MAPIGETGIASQDRLGLIVERVKKAAYPHLFRTILFYAPAVPCVERVPPVLAEGKVVQDKPRERRGS